MSAADQPPFLPWAGATYAGWGSGGAERRAWATEMRTCALVLDLSGCLWARQRWLFRRAPVARTLHPVFLGQDRHPNCHAPSQYPWGWY